MGKNICVDLSVRSLYPEYIKKKVLQLNNKKIIHLGDKGFDRHFSKINM